MKDINDIIEDIQQAQVEAGGRFIRQSEIKKMTILELLQLLVPNNVEFEFKYKPNHRNEQCDHDYQPCDFKAVSEFNKCSKCGKIN